MVVYEKVAMKLIIGLSLVQFCCFITSDAVRFVPANNGPRNDLHGVNINPPHYTNTNVNHRGFQREDYVDDSDFNQLLLRMQNENYFSGTEEDEKLGDHEYSKPSTIKIDLDDKDDVEIGDDNACVICLDRMMAEDRVLLDCSHKFHEKCLETWKRISKTVKCPVCRMKDTN